jgi:hypothetical protein
MVTCSKSDGGNKQKPNFTIGFCNTALDYIEKLNGEKVQ